MDFENPQQLRDGADQFRRAARILDDPTATTELLTIAAEWEVKALKIEAASEQNNQSQRSDNPGVKWFEGC